ncbi:hypothetical protein K474DRAFT_1294289 [Panus rudis PR-1116 ss-1]|nr:hypothetical protein K474DRAFT_1294289 [Panus rudis PR-1116 ss-1]
MSAVEEVDRASAVVDAVVNGHDEQHVEDTTKAKDEAKSEGVTTEEEPTLNATQAEAGDKKTEDGGVDDDASKDEELKKSIVDDIVHSVAADKDDAGEPLEKLQSVEVPEETPAPAAEEVKKAIEATAEPEVEEAPAVSSLLPVTFSPLFCHLLHLHRCLRPRLHFLAVCVSSCVGVLGWSSDVIDMPFIG